MKDNLDTLSEWGFSYTEIRELLKIKRTLANHAIRHCNAEIYQDDSGEWLYRDGTHYPERKTGALKRLQAIMDNHPDYVGYNQGDPRGCPLWIIPKDKLKGEPAYAVHNIFGVAVHE